MPCLHTYRQSQYLGLRPRSACCAALLQAGNLLLVELLLQCSARLDSRDVFGRTPLIYAGPPPPSGSPFHP